MRRHLGLWALLLALSAATLGIDAFPGSDYGGDEPHYLLAAESLVSDGDVDLTDEYAARDYRGFYPYVLDVHGEPTAGRLHEPHGIGFPLLIAPAYALGGARAVELFLAAIAALGFVLAAALARQVVPEPWATRGVLLVAVSPPALAYGATVYPELTAAAVLVGAALLAVRARETPGWRHALGAGALLALLPWLGPKFLLPGLPVLVAVVAWTWGRGRAVAALAAVEVVAVSLLTYARVNHALYGGLTPYVADVPGETATDAAFPAGYLERVPRLLWLWVDREYGLLRWAPVFALAAIGAWLLVRSWRSGIARVIPERRVAEGVAALMLAICAGAVIVAAFGAPTMFGFWFPPRHLVVALPAAAVLCAWGLRRAPRAGAALGGITVVSSAWLLAALWTGDHWVQPRTRAPLGPLEGLLPLFGT